MAFSYFIPFVFIGGVLAIWYWNYFRRARAAGGVEAMYQQQMNLQMQQEFGLPEGEQVIGHWNASAYMGPLEPGRGAPSILAWIFHFFATMNTRPAMMHVCTTVRGRVALSMEPKDGLDRLKALTAVSVGTSTAFYRPFALGHAGSARLLTFSEAFPGASYPRWNVPYFTNRAGKLVRFELVHWWMANGKGISMWIDPEAVAQIRQVLNAPTAQAA